MPKKKIFLSIVGNVSKMHQMPFDSELPARLEKALDRKIPKAAFLKIIVASSMYSVAAQTEGQSPTVGQFAKQVKKLRRVLRETKELVSHQGLHDRPPVQRKTGGAESEAIQREIERKYFQVRSAEYPYPQYIMLDMFTHALNALSAVADWCEEEVRKPSYPGTIRDASWEIWIILLTMIMKEYGLPYKVSNSTKFGAAKSSPFVAFVLELQSSFPKSLRRHSHGVDGMGKAIGRARKDTVIDESFSRMLESFSPSMAFDISKHEPVKSPKGKRDRKVTKVDAQNVPPGYVLRWYAPNRNARD